jgi:hypothetical protein
MQKNKYSDNPYILLTGPVYNPRSKMAPLVNSIRRKSDWESIGLKIITTKEGCLKSLKRDGLNYRYDYCLDDKLTQEQLNSL